MNSIQASSNGLRLGELASCIITPSMKEKLDTA